MFLKKMFRTIGKYRAQFISMIIMIALGVGVFLGFNMEWVSISENTAKFLKDSRFADYRIVDEKGFSAADAEKIRGIGGVSAAARYISVNAEVAGTENSLALTVTEDPAVSLFVVSSGEGYDAESVGDLWLFEKYAEKNGVNVGDTLELSYKGLIVSGTVKGLVMSGEYMICVRDETQLMPDFKTYGFVYASPKTLEKAVKDKYGEVIGSAALEKIYPQINVIGDLAKTEMSDRASEVLGKTVLVLGKEENISYSEAKGEESEGKTMGMVLPVVFLAIAVLTMVTTMHRLTANEKMQIGTFKALGFKDGKIARHYTSYALFIGLFGSAIGIGIGYLVAWYIMNPKGMMGTYISMPEWKLYMPWWCAAIIIAIVAFLTLIGFLSVKKMLAGTAADALRPYVPKKMKKIALEKTGLWKKFGFGTRWNLRDVIRHKSRSFMTLIGIVGCMVLLVGALGMNDTAKYFIKAFYEDAALYETRIYVSGNGEKTAAEINAEARDVAEKTNGDYSASVSVNITDKPVSLDVYNVARGNVGFLSEKSGKKELPENGALVCMRVAKEYGLKAGDKVTVSPYGTDEKYEIEIVGLMRSLTESIAISENYAKTLKSGETFLTESEVYRINSVYTSLNKDEIKNSQVYEEYKDDLTLQAKREVQDSFDSFMQILYMSVGVLIFVAVVLGVVVLYNLGVMSYTERYREMATLKVVGFKDGEIGKLLISQNLWLTVIGAIVGIFAGIGVLRVLMVLLASEYEMKVTLGPLTYIVSLLLTFGVSFIVGLLVARKTNRIDMTEALKGAE